MNNKNTINVMGYTEYNTAADDLANVVRSAVQECHNPNIAKVWEVVLELWSKNDHLVMEKLNVIE